MKKDMITQLGIWSRASLEVLTSVPSLTSPTPCRGAELYIRIEENMLFMKQIMMMRKDG